MRTVRCIVRTRGDQFDSARSEKRQFTEHCFRRAMEETERWIARLRARGELAFRDPAYLAMWARLNAEAGLQGMPA